MDEQTGTRLLRSIFEARGLNIEQDVPWEEGGRRVVLDGFDPVARVGFELITTKAGDRESFTPEVVAGLEARMARGEIYLLLIDEAEANEEHALAAAARGFLDRLAQMGRLP